MFASVLIANRGEIACRIIRTLRRFGIRAIAVYSDADREACHVRLADEAIRLGPADLAGSYLNAEAILAAAQRTGAEAIHPGYGFLAENADFAEAVPAAGLVFVGPPPAVIRAMGEKDRAKAIVAAAGLPLVPGHAGDGQSEQALRDAACAIGFPVMIKAAAGGGGKGMRVVRSADGFVAALEGAKREASSAFGDDRILLERYIERPRHVEVQVFGDRYGQIVHLFERDCSLQRRHQKVIEEAPAPGLVPEQRAAIGVLAVRAAQAVGYVNAGTVEFLLDRNGACYFLEMNTRLQVEHPVTELVTGLDLVEWQLRIAAGESLPLRQDEIRLFGHAIEARLYAEDPMRGFLPSTGLLVHLRFPPEGPELRVETGVMQGDRITPFYDPMIAKLVAFGPDRGTALRRIERALASTELVGLTSNLAFLQQLVAAPAFRAGEADTGTIDAGDIATAMASSPTADWVVPVAAWWLLTEGVRDAARNSAPASPWQRTDSWRLNDDPRCRLRFLVEGHPVEIEASRRGDIWLIMKGSRACQVHGRAMRDDTLEVVVDGHLMIITAVRHGGELTLFSRRGSAHIGLIDPLAVAATSEWTAGALAAPMPGKIIRRHVAVGERVAAGSPLLVLEAMKMEHTITAPADGAVTALHVGEGDQVEEGVVLVDFEATAG